MKKILAWVRPRLANIGLQWRLQLLTAAGLLVIFAFFWVAGRQALQASTRQSLDQQLAVAGWVASSLDYQLNTALNLLKSTATQPDLRRPGPTPQQTLLLKDAQLQLSAYGRRLHWLDSSGNILWSEPDMPGPVLKPFPHLSAIRPALDGNAPYISHLCRASGSTPYILLAVPVTGPAGQPAGLLVEEVTPDRLGVAGMLDQLAPAGNAYIQVVDDAGNIVASSLAASGSGQVDRPDRFAGLLKNRQPVVSRCHQCHPSGSATAHNRPTEEVLAFAPLETVSWGVAVRQPAREVMAPANRLRQTLLLGGGVILAAALATSSWIIGRQIIGPIRALGEASVQWAAGNLAAPIRRGGIDEVARLTANLEQMRARLDVTLADHRRWNEALEEMVQERTHELASLYEQVQSKEMMCKRLLGKVLTTQEEERARLARELHDAIGQSLTAVIMTTTAVENTLPPDFVTGKEKLASVRQIATQALQDLRNLIFDLRPEILDDLGLALALRSQVKKYLEPAGINVRLRADRLKDQLPAEVERAVFRVVQEAITNIARHARASQANISLIKKDNRLIVRVEDNGIGFEPEQVLNGQHQAWGLHGMEERITLLGGKFYIGAKPGQGTLILAEIPLTPNGPPPFEDNL